MSAQNKSQVITIMRINWKMIVGLKVPNVLTFSVLDWRRDHIISMLVKNLLLQWMKPEPVEIAFDYPVVMLNDLKLI